MRINLNQRERDDGLPIHCARETIALTCRYKSVKRQVLPTGKKFIVIVALLLLSHRIFWKLTILVTNDSVYNIILVRVTEMEKNIYI